MALAINFHHPFVIALGGFLALAIAIGIGRFVYTPILPYMVAGLEIGRTEAGLIASANFLGYLVGALVAAVRVMPGSRRYWLISALLVSVASTVAMGFFGSMGAFLVLRFAGGVASAFVLIFASAIVLDQLSLLRRPDWMSMLYAGVGGGIALSSIIVFVVSSIEESWRPLWLISGVAALIILIPAWWLLPLKKKSMSDSTDTNASSRIKSSRDSSSGWRLVTAYGLFGFGYIITATFVSDLVRTNPSLNLFEHLVWLMVGLTAAPSVVLWAWVGKHWGTNRAFAIACIVEAIGVAISAASSNIFLLLLAASLLGGTFMGITALGLVSARIQFADNVRRGLALMTASFGLGQMIGPLCAGVLYDSLGSYLMPSLLASIALIIASALVFQKTDRVASTV